MENWKDTFNKTFLETLESGIEWLPQDIREKLYRPCATGCVQGYVLEEMRRQAAECGNDLDLQYEKYGRTETFFADIVERGHIYEIGYPRCLCPLVGSGFKCPAGHCECSRQSILYILEELNSDKKFSVETMHTVLSGADECRFRVTVQR